jgi:hypothetical protein
MIDAYADGLPFDLEIVTTLEEARAWVASD